MDNMIIELKLTVAQINVILNHLGRGSYVEVQPIVDDIRAQAIPQLASVQTLDSSQEQAQQLAS